MNKEAYAKSIDDCVHDLELQIDWIENIEGHQFPGWMNTVNAMRRAIALLEGFSLYDA